MAEILEVFHLPDEDRMADVNVGCGRVESGFDPERLAGLLRALQLFEQFLFTDDFDGAAADVFELFFNRNCFEVAHLFVGSSSLPWSGVQILATAEGRG